MALIEGSISQVLYSDSAYVGTQLALCPPGIGPWRYEAVCPSLHHTSATVILGSLSYPCPRGCILLKGLLNAGIALTHKPLLLISSRACWVSSRIPGVEDQLTADCDVPTIVSSRNQLLLLLPRVKSLQRLLLVGLA